MKVTVFGATGVIGTGLVEILVKEHTDWEITAVTRRSDPSSSNDCRLASLGLSNVQFKTANPKDLSSVQEITKDSDLIFCTIGFARYERKYWATHWPPIVDNLLSVVTKESGKKLIFCDNLYSYGNPAPDAVSTQQTTFVTPSLKSKPAIRALLRQKFQHHMEKCPGQVTVVGASDFFGPHLTQVSFLGDTFIGKMVEGQTPLAIGSANCIHDFCYAKDFSRALAVAAVSPKAYDKFWICPNSIRNKTLQDIANDVAKILAKKQQQEEPSKDVKITVLSTWMLRLMSPFMGFAWEMLEMMHEWIKDYRIDACDFDELQKSIATPYEEALQETVDFFLEQKTKK